MQQTPDLLEDLEDFSLTSTRHVSYYGSSVCLLPLIDTYFCVLVKEVPSWFSQRFPGGGGASCTAVEPLQSSHFSKPLISSLWGVQWEFQHRCLLACRPLLTQDFS